MTTIIKESTVVVASDEKVFESLVDKFDNVPASFTDDWSAFTKFLSKNRLKSKCKTDGLVWGLSDQDCADPHVRLLSQAWNKKSATPKEQALLQMMQVLDLPVQQWTVVHATLALGLTQKLVALSKTCSLNTWAGIFQKLFSVVQDIEIAAPDDVLALQLVAVELPLRLAVQLPSLRLFDEFTAVAFDRLFDEQREWLDSDGAIHASLVDRMIGFLACWTRCQMLADDLEIQPDEAAQLNWEWFLRYSMRMCRADGSMMLTSGQYAYSLELFKSAIKTSTDKDDKLIARQLLPGANANKKRTESFTEQGVFSEWAGLGVLQADWDPDSPRIALAVHEDVCDIEVCRAQSLVRIHRLPNVSINGKLLGVEQDAEWEEVFSHFDDDLNYVELELQLQDGVRLQRQLIHPADDDLFLIADSVFATVAERIDYRLDLTLPPSVTAMQETENSEIYLQRQRKNKLTIESVMLPVGVSEWKQRGQPNCFDVLPTGVALQQSIVGSRLYAPLAIQLNSKKSLLPRTWRKLTVAEKLELQTDDVAVAYRIRIGDDQLVIYKSFDEPGNRTFLGQNHSCDFFIGRLKPDGSVKELLSVEA